MSGFPTTDTFSSLIDEVITSLKGFTLLADQPYSTTWTTSSTALSISTDATSIGRGVIEIDEELIYITANNGAGQLTVPAWGRGWKGTTATTHGSGVMVNVAPVYPRAVVSREVNNTIRAVFPDLFAVATVDKTGSSTNWQYEMPAACERVLSVEWRWDTVSGWNPVTDWELTCSAYTTDFATGKFLSITEAIPVSAKIHITYAAAPTLLTTSADTYAATTGLPATSRDVIVLGAASRLLPWIDTGRTPATTVPSDMTDQQRPIGTAVQLARELRTRYTEALVKERNALYAKYPIRAHRIRS